MVHKLYQEVGIKLLKFGIVNIIRYYILLKDILMEWYILIIIINIFWKWSVAFSSDGEKIVSGSSDETIKIWDNQTYESLQTLDGGGLIRAEKIGEWEIMTNTANGWYDGLAAFLKLLQEWSPEHSKPHKTPSAHDEYISITIYIAFLT